MAEVRITGTGHETELRVDGALLHECSDYAITQHAGEMARVRLTLVGVPGPDVTIDGVRVRVVLKLDRLDRALAALAEDMAAIPPGTSALERAAYMAAGYGRFRDAVQAVVDQLAAGVGIDPASG